jgi:hypothetical protein
MWKIIDSPHSVYHIMPKLSRAREIVILVDDGIRAADILLAELTLVASDTLAI